ALDDNASTLYCWWGQNEISPYYYSPHSETYESWKINASKWLVMEFTSSNEIIKQDVNNVLNVNIKHYFDNETKEIYDYDEDINLPLTVKFYTNTGQTIAEVELVNGSASINYIPANNVKTVYAKLSNQTIEISVKQKNESKLIASDLSKYYKENKDLEIKLTDNDNNPLYNKTVKILLNGKEYNLATNNNGIVKVPLDLNIGTYTAKISFDDEEYRNQNKNVKITVLKNKTSIKASNLVKYYKNSTKLSVKLLDNNKKPLKSKTVKIRIAGKTYSKTTNSKGIATFAINQKVGTYSVKISFNGDKTYQSSSKTIKVYVKSAKLTTKTKKIHRKSYFVATLKDKNGKAIKKTKVKFKLNGKTYTRTTNNKGIAKLKITVKIGTYKIKTSFKSTKIYGATVFTNKIKVLR
ncbi:MAG: Ig-like domain repeat protein, partial [Methanobrevibacter sp.]|nr:Ig-like domain repeat protein [Methanobrevibacter sp.]